ncbi:MAG: hypothetical protein J7647_24120 [Cyanobacteria bacterium SBLK]|nr:hypothetical protein [Cyanobacteria bacterium SBLK]
MSEELPINEPDNVEVSSPEFGEETSKSNVEELRRVEPQNVRDNVEETKPNEGISPETQRKFIKLRVTRLLAISLWGVLLGLVACHFYTVTKFATKLTDIQPTPDVDSSVYIKEAIRSTNETAKTLYTFLGTLAAAVTGYFFEEARREDNR